MIRLAIGIAAIAMVIAVIINPKEAGKVPALFILGFQETMNGSEQ